MKIKPGKYVQRDGGIATVAAVDESRNKDMIAVGWTACGNVSGWNLDGSFFEGEVRELDLVSEYREPREYWVLRGVLYLAPPITDGRDHEIIHVREVLK